MALITTASGANGRQSARPFCRAAGVARRPASKARARTDDGARVGQTQSIVVDRGGRTVVVQLTLAGLPPMGVVAYLASGLTGLSFLAFGLWAYFSAPRRTSRLLALVGIGLGAVFTEQPYVAFPFARALQESGLIVAGVFGFAVLPHFVLAFPTERRILGRKAAMPAIYAPAAIVSAVKVAATVLGLAPMIPTVADLVAPGVVFPAGDYYDLTWVLIPFALARATILQARSASAGTAGA